MGNDRAGGTSGPSGNPPAVFHSIHPSYLPLVDRLARRGFSDACTAEAGFMLERVSYRHMMPYLRAVEEGSGSAAPTVKEAHDLLTFDRRFRAVLFKYIGVFEAQLRAQYAHWMEEAHGPLCLYDERLFLRAEGYRRSLGSLEREVSRKRSEGMRRALQEGRGKLPVWDAVECMTLGTLGQFFSNTAEVGVTRQVSGFFGATKSEFSSWVKTVTAVRNICAHYEPYLTRREIPSTPLAMRGIGLGNRSTFYVAVLLSRFLGAGMPFLDLNLAYAYRLWADLREVIGAGMLQYPAWASLLRIPEDWPRLLDEASHGAVSCARAVEAELNGT